MGSVLIRFRVRFVVGVFLFLTGVRGIIVAFLYVVALCPNPVFTGREGDSTYVHIIFVLLFLSFVCPITILGVRRWARFGSESGRLREGVQ